MEMVGSLKFRWLWRLSALRYLCSGYKVVNTVEDGSEVEMEIEKGMETRNRKIGQSRRGGVPSRDMDFDSVPSHRR
jgi:hypothetical protein